MLETMNDARYKLVGLLVALLLAWSILTGMQQSNPAQSSQVAPASIVIVADGGVSPPPGAG